MFQKATYNMHSLYAVTKYKVVGGEFAKVYTKLFLKSRQILQITHDEKINLL